MAWETISTDAMPMYASGNNGGLLAGAGGGALVGGLVGGWLGNWFGNGNGRNGTAQEVENFSLFKEISDTRKDVVEQTVALQTNQFGIQRDIFNTQLEAQRCCCNTQNEIAMTSAATQRDIMKNNYDNLLQTNQLQAQLAECCCDNKLLITTTGLEAQLREQTNFGAVMNRLTELNCRINDVEKDSIIRSQADTIDALRTGETRRIVADVGQAVTSRLGTGINQLGLNQVNTAPDTSLWPPAFFGTAYNI